ncbi:zinc-binding dehydrogenase [Actinacidiphila bryophytorum]|uniref:NADPH2:quinone reductase n=1 Tax=Actinacidiphila bryophytorum TaxID=1436133 RepID=A0A9W4E6U2_9ACTN|nr:zinc-binding dehydrogenase [Actinacidiphila bryophytorum]MBM9434690.1 zinc-binding dehydrogenase [Actinacidiphila bryophytorum]MBN6547941.1 zinc-binding dehydrogenase [Actinacidiphila bryophytorum]CAG7628913.1 NADPH2:quinone reductase [Actinacidiphila bryophytorum]
MRVIRVREFGPPDVLKVDDAPEPQPGAGEVVVAVEAAGVIYGDVIIRSGGYPFPLPYVPGLEVGGRVVDVGPDADRGLLGQRVVATTPGSSGGYAELARAATADLHTVPDGLSVQQAVAVFQAGGLAVGLLAAMRVAPGETVLITAAAGRIGSLLVQLAKSAGATVVAAAGGPVKTAAARALGADLALDYTRPGWAERVGGADVVLDAVGGDIGGQALTAARGGSGRFGFYGFTSGAWTHVDPVAVASRGLTVVGAAGIAFAQPPAAQRAATATALAAAAAGELAVTIHATRPLPEAAAAHTALAARATLGATLLTP